METLTRTCCRCDKSKHQDDFTAGKGWCKECHNKRAREWRLANVERNREIQKQNYQRRKLN